VLAHVVVRGWRPARPGNGEGAPHPAFLPHAAGRGGVSEADRRSLFGWRRGECHVAGAPRTWGRYAALLDMNALRRPGW